MASAIDYFYVKSGGTCPANSNAGMVSGAARSGGFAAMDPSTYYGNIADAVNTSKAFDPSRYALIVVSHLHNHNYGATGSFNLRDATAISVDDTDVRTYLRGAKETATSTFILADSIFGGTFVGFDFESGSTMYFGLTAGSAFWARDCKFTIDGGILFGVQADGCFAQLDDCILERLTSGTYMMRVSNGSKFVMNGGSCISPVATLDELLTSNSGTDGGAHIEFNGVDFTGMTATPSNPWLAIPTNSALDHTEILFNRCKFPAGLTQLPQPLPWGSSDNEVKIKVQGTNSWPYNSVTSFRGIVETDFAEYLNATYDNGTTGFSIQASTINEGREDRPLEVDLGIIPVNDMTVGKTITVELISSLALTDKQFWLELWKPDGTDYELRVRQTTRNANLYFGGPGTEGVTLTTSEAAWNVGTGNKYSVDIVVPADVGGNPRGYLELKAMVAIESVDVNIDPAFTVV